MLAKSAIAAIAVLAAAPGVTAVAWSLRPSADVPAKAVELRGPILSFTRTIDRIQVRLTAPRDESVERTLTVEDAAGDHPALTLKLRRKQDYVSARLPEGLAEADALVIAVD